ncbi:hypothetical protein EXQ37_10850 [Clostridium botulinum]|nr:hypothetical protein [Clostridium botulinum]MBO0560224.1 hypothetical protein [Clostridium botulinum]
MFGEDILKYHCINSSKKEYKLFKRTSTKTLDSKFKDILKEATIQGEYLYWLTYESSNLYLNKWRYDTSESPTNELVDSDIRTYYKVCASISGNVFVAYNLNSNSRAVKIKVFNENGEKYANTFSESERNLSVSHIIEDPTSNKIAMYVKHTDYSNSGTLYILTNYLSVVSQISTNDYTFLPAPSKNALYSNNIIYSQGRSYNEYIVFDVSQSKSINSRTTVAESAITNTKTNQTIFPNAGFVYDSSMNTTKANFSTLAGFSLDSQLSGRRLEFVKSYNINGSSSLYASPYYSSIVELIPNKDPNGTPTIRSCTEVNVYADTVFLASGDAKTLITFIGASNTFVVYKR